MALYRRLGSCRDPILWPDLGGEIAFFETSVRCNSDRPASPQPNGSKTARIPRRKRDPFPRSRRRLVGPAFAGTAGIYFSLCWHRQLEPGNALLIAG